MLLEGLLAANAALAPLALNALANTVFFAPLAPRPATPPQGMVSVLVTARNEAARLAPLLESLLALDDRLPVEFIVYDDDSEDDTAALVASYAARDARMRLVRGEALPPGWNGKCHGLHRLSQEARGDYWLFLDADVTLSPGALERAVAALEAGDYDVLSLYPQQVLESWAERLFVPVMVYYFFLLGPQWLHRIGARVPVAPLNGQFMLWRRASYERAGGYAAIASAWLDDMAMGRRVAALGLSAVYRPGVGLARCRMYTDLASTWRGFVKHTWDCLGLPVGPYLLLHAWLFVAMVLPWALMLGALGRPWSPAEILAAAGVLVLSLASRLPACWRGGGGWSSALAHPLSMAAALVVGLVSLWQFRSGTHEWRGRARQPEALP